ncbi:hypothetical protein ACFXJO_10375 [Streptomyces lavendulae]|uniref:hypothetical protein n=1 Tax=Streptomyces lavendulae TaxID=1914 RepID=UPI00369F4607
MSHNTGWEHHHPQQPAPQWGGGWAPPPPPPQPGVIPLRPLGVGDLLGGAFTAFRRYWKPLAGVILGVQGIGILLVAVAIGVAALSVDTHFAEVFDPGPGERPAGADVMALLVYFVPALVLMLLTMTLGMGMIAALCPAVIQEAVLGRPTTFRAMWRRCWSRMPSVLGVVLLIGLIAGGPVIVLYAICFPLVFMASDGSGPPAAAFLMFLGVLLWMPVSVWLTVRFSLAPAVAVCEGLGPVASLRRSTRLVSGGWWRVFGVSLLAYLLSAAVGYIIQLPFTFLGMFALFPSMLAAGDEASDATVLIVGIVVYALCVLLGIVISGVFQFGFPQLVVSLLYVDQRIRKENLAEGLIAEVHAPTAAVPGQG